MSTPSGFSFIRYLSAKKSVDDRALNRFVWERLRAALADARELRVLEVGGGIGTMVERLVEWDLCGAGRADGRPVALRVTLIDAQPEYVAEAGQRLPRWGLRQGLEIQRVDGGLVFTGTELTLAVSLEAIDLFEFVAREQGRCTWDLLIAHAVLDVVDVPRVLPFLVSLLEPGGLIYLTVAFDGVTALEPTIDAAFDARVEALYHAGMDARMIDGFPSGGSRTGRRLYHQLRAAGVEVLAMGSSDWVVHPATGGYQDDEAYFLHFIVNTIWTALRDHPDLDRERFAAWIDQRHMQIEKAEMLYIAHQLDVLGRGRGSRE